MIAYAKQRVVINEVKGESVHGCLSQTSVNQEDSNELANH